jgi:aminomethyltransferase
VSDAERHVPLESVHRSLGATFTAFGGWLMPVRYGSDLEEHRAVRERVGLFDISHMGQLELRGSEVAEAIERVVVSRVADLALGRARYTMLCDDAGGVIDDVIVYHLADHHLVIANAANTAAVVAALRAAITGLDVELALREDRALLALQGPRAQDVLRSVEEPRRTDAGTGAAADLRPFGVTPTWLAGCEVLVARTGYTGEDGFELACDAVHAEALWTALLAAGEAHGLIPCGLASRDTLRLEAGLPLHGHELGPVLGPFETGFGRIVHLDRATPIRGGDVLARRASAGPERRIVGLVAEGRRSPRAGYPVRGTDGREVGIVTSGAPSPTLGVPIALAAVDAAHAGEGTGLVVDVRGSLVAAQVVPLPFVRRGR